jgi:hypothetical protein
LGELRKIHLNNSVEDPTYLREQLGGELFRAADAVPRVGHALVVLDGRSRLYVLKEGFTEELLARHFRRGDGLATRDGDTMST